MRARVLALALFSIGFAGCGGGNPEIGLVISEDNTWPCLGAAHMKIQVNSDAGMSEFHEFGQFFDTHTHKCAIGQYRFSGLPLGSGIQVAVSMHDSTADPEGHLASGSSQTIDVKENTPYHELPVPLTRTTAALGSVVIYRPADWDAVSGINRLNYHIMPDGEIIPVRSGSFTYAPELRSDPFPLIVSALELPAEMTQYQVVVEARQVDVLVRTWTGEIFLSTGYNPAFLEL